MWFGILGKEERAFYRQSLDHWKELVLGATAGGFILVLYAIAVDLWDLPKFPGSGYALVVGLFAIQAFFLAWRTEYRRAEELLLVARPDAQLKPILVRVPGHDQGCIGVFVLNRSNETICLTFALLVRRGQQMQRLQHDSPSSPDSRYIPTHVSLGPKQQVNGMANFYWAGDGPHIRPPYEIFLEVQEEVSGKTMTMPVPGSAEWSPLDDSLVTIPSPTRPQEHRAGIRFEFRPGEANEPWLQLNKYEKSDQRLWRVGVAAPVTGPLRNVRIYTEGEAFLGSHELQVSGLAEGIGTVDIAADTTRHFDFLLEQVPHEAAPASLCIVYAKLMGHGMARTIRRPPVDGVLVITADNEETVRIAFQIVLNDKHWAVPIFSSSSDAPVSSVGVIPA